MGVSCPFFMQGPGKRFREPCTELHSGASRGRFISDEHITIKTQHVTSGKEAETGHLEVRKMSNDVLLVLVVLGFEPITTGCCHFDK